jgi:hypothetical protein
LGDLDGVGDVVTGSLLARAVEPSAGEDGHTTEKACLNCGTLLIGSYCHICGQKAHVHRSLRAFGADLFSGMFNFEGKIWRTLPMLAWKPGEMTRRYIDGERARYVSPVALYLFSVFAMFAVLTFNGTIGDTRGPIRNGIQESINEQRAAIRKLEEQRKTLAARGAGVSALDRKIAAERKDLADLERLDRGELVTFDAGESVNGVPPWARGALEKAQKDPGGAVNQIQDAASKYSWLLIPLSLPFMWLLFPFSRRYHLYDHTVFVTYSLSFMMMLVILGGLFVAANLPSLASMLFLVPPIHMYRQMKGAYALGWFSALVRTTALMIFCFCAVVLFAVAMVAIGLL